MATPAMTHFSTARRFFMCLLSVGLGLAAQPHAQAETIAVIGAGNVAGVLGPAFARQGHTVVYGVRDSGLTQGQELAARTAGKASVTSPAKAAAGADMVVLAVPGTVVEEVVRGLGDLSEKIILDPTNPVAFTPDGRMVHVVETSNGELIQSIAPAARVVKAFNTLGTPTMSQPGGPVTIPLAGNDPSAKAVVAKLVLGMGLEPLDVGRISAAHVLEEMLVLKANAGTPYEYHFRRPAAASPE